MKFTSRKKKLELDIEDIFNLCVLASTHSPEKVKGDEMNYTLTKVRNYIEYGQDDDIFRVVVSK